MAVASSADISRPITTVDDQSVSSSGAGERGGGGDDDDDDDRHAQRTVKYEKNIEAAIRLLARHPTKIDPLRALKMLPPSLPIPSVRLFLETVTKHFLSERREGQIFRNLLLSQHMQVQAQRIHLQQSLKLVVDEHDVCSYCQKRIGKRWVLSAAIRNACVAHFAATKACECAWPASITICN